MSISIDFEELETYFYLSVTRYVSLQPVKFEILECNCRPRNVSNFYEK